MWLRFRDLAMAQNWYCQWIILHRWGYIWECNCGALAIDTNAYKWRQMDTSDCWPSMAASFEPSPASSKSPWITRVGIFTCQVNFQSWKLSNKTSKHQQARSEVNLQPGSYDGIIRIIWHRYIMVHHGISQTQLSGAQPLFFCTAACWGLEFLLGTSSPSDFCSDWASWSSNRLLFSDPRLLPTTDGKMVF